MKAALLYRLLADLVLFSHAAFVLFVVGGFVLILAGGLRNWRWVRNRWFRTLHLVALGVVVLQAWCGQICPLTLLEAALRERAGDAVYEGAFIAHWVERLLFYSAPAWVFSLAYSVFGIVVAASWYLVRPEWRSRRRDEGEGDRGATRNS